MIPQNLQNHMLYVASLSQIILENWTENNFDQDSIIKASLFHDIGKPLRFDLSKQAQFGMSENDIKKLKKLQDYLKSKYDNEHQATVAICQDLGLSVKAVEIVNNLEWSYIPKLLKVQNIESLIPIYCDMRIGPSGVVTLTERLEELDKRIGIINFEERISNGTLLEQKIKENVKIDLNSISNDQINKGLKTLRQINI